LLHCLTHACLFVLVLMLINAGAVSAGDARVELKEMTYVSSAGVFLKDIASVRDTDSLSRERIENLLIAPAPEYGRTQIYSRNQIADRIKSAGKDIPPVVLKGAAITRIRTRGRPAGREELVAVIRNYLAETTPWNADEITVGAITNLEKIELPPGHTELKISSKSPVIGKRKILVAIDALREGKILSSNWVTAAVNIRTNILRAAKKIPYGKKISAEDFENAVAEIDNPNADYCRDDADVLGKISKRNFAVGDPLTREAIEMPFLVNSGDIVQLKIERKGLVLTSLVRAEQDGRLGQVIRVRHLEFSSLLNATVTGRAEVGMP
jgi:flagella basal body P-ring formation protein FlgA